MYTHGKKAITISDSKGQYIHSHNETHGTTANMKLPMIVNTTVRAYTTLALAHNMHNNTQYY
jgi:hypothetical protein